MTAPDYFRRVGAKIAVGMHQPLFHRFRLACQHPKEATKETLVSLLRAAPQGCTRNPEVLAKLLRDPDRIIERFSEAIPLADFESYRPWIDQLKSSNKAQLRMFGLTSGSTGDSKFVPINNAFLKAYRRAWKLWGYRTFTDHPAAATGSFLQFSSPWQRFQTAGGTWCGAMSGLTMAMQPWMVQRYYTLPLELGGVEDTRDRYYMAACMAFAKENVSFICTANPMTLINFTQWANDRAERLIRDLHDGIDSSLLNGDGVSAPTVLNCLRKRQPRRARELEAIFVKEGRFAPELVWPRLKLISVWTGGSMGHYLPTLKRIFGATVSIRDPGFMATEGYFALPLQDESPDGVLNIWGHHFEFIPLKSVDNPTARLLQADEIARDEIYEIVVSSSNGLFRYRMNDLIQCSGHWGRVPLIRFLHKGRDISSLVGEKLSAFQVSLALRQTSFEGTDRNPFHAVLVPCRGEGLPFYTLKASGYHQHANLAADFDGCLQKLNDEYRERRKSERLGPVVLERVHEDFFRAFADSPRNRLGHTLEQLKMPVLLTEFHQRELLRHNVR